MAFNGFVLAGTHSGVGKTTITAGILSALKRRGLCVQPFKSGPDYIDPAFHSFVVGKKSRNLDTWLLSDHTVRYLFAENCEEADVAVVEGVMGLFDGFGGTEDIGSTASLAKTLKLPVILIIDGAGMARSAAAMVLGFSTFDQDCHVAGVIVNRVSSKKHYELLKESIERYTNVACLGYVQNNQQIELSSRHLGLIPAAEVVDLEERLAEVAKMVEETVDLDRILELSKMEKPETLPHPVKDKTGFYTGINVGIALDESFNFYYWDNIELLELLGCNCVFFSPIHDESLPQHLDFIYIGGGFPEVFGKQLSSNKKMLKALSEFHQSGRPIYAECGGLMYLTEAIIDLKGERHLMTGILPGETVMTGKLKHFGYNEIETDASLTAEPIQFRGHEFHRSEFIGHQLPPKYHLYKNRYENNETHWQCGYQSQMAFGAYAHVHFYSEPNWLYFWLDQAVTVKETYHESI